MAAAPGQTRSQRVALIGLGVNLTLAVLKLVAGLVGHCYALVADAMESITDIVGSVVIWGGLHIGAKPADTDHPYGHGKAESLAALVVAVIVGLAGVGILIKAIDEILTPHHTPAWWTLVVLVAVVVIKEGMSRFAAHVSRTEGNTTMSVEAGHHRADVITSLAAFVGISVALAGEHGLFGKTAFNWASADDYAAVLGSLVIMYNACRLASLPLRELMDASPLQELDAARAATMTVAGVKGIEKCRARTSGSRHYIEMHIEVDPLMTVADAHVITGKVKAAVRKAVPTVADIHLHVEPHEPSGASSGGAALSAGSPPLASASATPPNSPSPAAVEGTDIHPNR